MNRTRAAVALGLMALVAGVAGCGDDDEEPQGAVLGDQLDELAASAAGDGDTTRPEAVALFEGLIADGQADEVAAEVSAWVVRSEEHTSEIQSLMRTTYAVFCLKKKKNIRRTLH